ncbi:unnamed protein product [Gongylonema pulchrum]|uniref:TPR_REGION domain-containing protein n=1 Tax=Gongylonema pulchrum TaxID=637853 RepID=A0A183EZI8_9BILA|nr:unnamed protein product [Gongylonema pulchrum]
MPSDRLTELSEKANCAFLNGNFRKALELYSQAIQIYPGNHVLHSNRSAVFLHLQRFHESLYDAEQSIQINPKWAKGYLRKGDALRAAKKFDKSILSYCQGLALGSAEIFAPLKDSLRCSIIKGAIFFTVFMHSKI